MSSVLMFVNSLFTWLQQILDFLLEYWFFAVPIVGSIIFVFLKLLFRFMGIILGKKDK